MPTWEEVEEIRKCEECRERFRQNYLKRESKKRWTDKKAKYVVVEFQNI